LKPKLFVERPTLRVGRSAPTSPSAPATDFVAVEEPLEIRVAGEPLAVTMRTPGDDARLAVGFLFAEGVLRSALDVGTVSHCGRPGDEGYGNVIDLIPAPGADVDPDRVMGARRGTLTTAACGVCGRKTIDDLLAQCGSVTAGDMRMSTAQIGDAPRRLKTAQTTFEKTGGTHAAAALSTDGEVLSAAEDVGRHNAVDKVIGALVLSGAIDRRVPGRVAAAALVVSGRASFEIIQKAAMANIPVVVSVSAASSLAIDLADRVGITLCTFVRGAQFNVHTHPSRVV
jgi:FdhD protein